MFWLLLLMMAAGGGAGAAYAAYTPDATPDATDNDDEGRKNVVRRARLALGNTYRFGAEVPRDLPESKIRDRDLDCSELIQWAFSPHMQMPDGTKAQIKYGVHIPVSTALQRPGNLVFQMRGGSPYHVALTTGLENGTAFILHAEKPGGFVLEVTAAEFKWDYAIDPWLSV